MRTSTLLLLLPVLFLLISNSAQAKEDKGVTIDKDHLVGIWIAHEFESEAGDTKPRIQFMKDGSFRMKSQFGRVKEGKWKWIGDNKLELTYPEYNKTISITVDKLEEERLVTMVRRKTNYKRTKIWEDKKN